MILKNIIDQKEREVAQARRERPMEALVRAVEKLPPARSLKAALRGRDCAIIAEIKRRSPSKGQIRQNVDPPAIAVLYEQNGAAAISVLTDRVFFGGSVEDLLAVRRVTSLPVLRKDFIVDPYQIYETRLLGADAVLLIADILDDETLAGFLARAAYLGLDCLVEAHDRPALERAVAAGAQIVGINNRDLNTFSVDLETSIDLRPHVPPDRMVVSESAIGGRSDIERLLSAGISAFLVGETLMRADDMGEALRALLGRKEG